jgi:hypothetical protein
MDGNPNRQEGTSKNSSKQSKNWVFGLWTGGTMALKYSYMLCERSRHLPFRRRP